MQHEWRNRIDQYLVEGRSVSGGDVDPGGHPGHKVITLSADDETAASQLDAAEEAGYELKKFSNGRAILDNYGKK